MDIEMKKAFSFVLCALLISMKSVCACEMVQIPHASSQQQTQEHEGCHGHEEESSKPTHHACICIDHDSQALITDSVQIHPSVTPIADLHWEYVDFLSFRTSSELLVYYHSPPLSRPLYLTQVTLLI